MKETQEVTKSLVSADCTKVFLRKGACLVNLEENNTHVDNSENLNETFSKMKL